MIDANSALPEVKRSPRTVFEVVGNNIARLADAHGGANLNKQESSYTVTGSTPDDSEHVLVFAARYTPAPPKGYKQLDFISAQILRAGTEEVLDAITVALQELEGLEIAEPAAKVQKIQDLLGELAQTLTTD